MPNVQSYERSNLEIWFKRCQEAGRPCTDPLTRQVLRHTTVRGRFKLLAASCSVAAAVRARWCCCCFCSICCNGRRWLLLFWRAEGLVGPAYATVLLASVVQAQMPTLLTAGGPHFSLTSLLASFT